MENNGLCCCCLLSRWKFIECLWEPADRPSERCDQMTIEMGSVGQKTNQDYLGGAMPEARDDLGFSFIHLHMASITVIDISI